MHKIATNVALLLLAVCALVSTQEFAVDEAMKNEAFLTPGKADNHMIPPQYVRAIMRSCAG
jgi:hypothetical protein